MNKLLATVLSTMVLAGCASTYKPVPDGYTGPTALIRDSALTHDSSKADLFYANAVDGNRIPNSRFATEGANRGMGMSMKANAIARPLPIKPVTLEIVGRTQYAAPIQAMTRTVYEVKGNVQFTPEPDKVYVVRGELGEAYSVVWLEDESTKAVIGQKIEVKGSAALGFMQK